MSKFADITYPLGGIAIHANLRYSIIEPKSKTHPKGFICERECLRIQRHFLQTYTQEIFK